MQAKANYILKGTDTLSYNFGGNIFKPDNVFSPAQTTTATMGQGLSTTTTYQDFQLGYLVNPVTNFNIVLGLINRQQRIAGQIKQTQIVYFGIRTSLQNFYFDF